MTSSVYYQIKLPLDLEILIPADDPVRLLSAFVEGMELKENLCLAEHRTQNEKTLHANLILADVTQLITIVLADKIKHHEYIRSLKPLIA